MGASLSASCAGRKGAGLRLRRRSEYQTAAEKVSARHRKGRGLLCCQRRKSRRLNAEAIQRDRCVIWQGSVQRIIFASDWFDAVTAFETVYFWPDLAKCFREVWRVLKPGGTFLICNEVNGDTDKDKKWTEIIDGMTIYKDTELKAYLEQAGFCDIAVHKSKTGWLCLTAVKRSDCGCGRQENEGL